MAVLKFVKGANLGATKELNAERIVVGRNADCFVVLNVPAVSREHAVIRRIQGKYYIEDLKSRNGTFVNNKEVTARTLLKDNDKIKICDNEMAFYEGSAPKKELPPEMVAGADVEADEPDSSTVEATLNQSSKQVLEAQPAEKLAMLLEISAELSQTFNQEQLLPKIVDRLFGVFRQADRAFIVMSDEGRLIPRVTKTRRQEDEGKATFSRKIINRCIDTGQSFLSEDAMADSRLGDLSQSIADCRIRSVMCVPLMSRGDNKAFGVIQLDTQDRFKKFTQDDLKLLLSVAGQAAVAVENAQMHETIVARSGLERDLKLANQVQMSFLPKRAPQPAGYEFAAHYLSAQEVGGDYYDFIPLPGPRYGVMLGDVAGKGVPAALLMAKVSADARFCMLTEPDLATAVGKLNEQMQEAGLLDRFVTLGAGLIEPAKHQVTFVNAGHLPPLVYRKATNSFEEGISRDQSGFPLGVVEGIPYESAMTNLDSGDSVLLFTDGITEAKNKNDVEFQFDGVLTALKNCQKTPKAMVDCLVAAIREHAKGCKQHDDITIVAFGRL